MQYSNSKDKVKERTSSYYKNEKKGVAGDRDS